AEWILGLAADPAQMQQWVLARTGLVVGFVASTAGDLGRLALDAILAHPAPPALVLLLPARPRAGAADPRRGPARGGRRRGRRGLHARRYGPRGDVWHALDRAHPGGAAHARRVDRRPRLAGTPRRDHRAPGAHTARAAARLRPGLGLAAPERTDHQRPRTPGLGRSGREHGR